LVVSIGDKSDEMKLMQVRVRETTTRKSRHSVVIQRLVVETRGFSINWDKPAGDLNYWAGGDRRRGDVTLTWALMRNCGNQGIDAKGEGTSGRNREAESTDA
jgi:hypothetical protein